jgi:hypothetical protein
MDKNDGAASLVRSDALLERLADTFQGRSYQCSDMAIWLDLNDCAELSDRMREIASILRNRADAYRANAPLERSARSGDTLRGDVGT